MSEVERLSEIGEAIHHQLQRGRHYAIEAMEAQLAIGRLIREARQILPSHQHYGHWFAAQDFGFSPQWGTTLRRCAENEDGIRRAFADTEPGAFNLQLALRNLLYGSVRPAAALVVERLDRPVTMRELAELVCDAAGIEADRFAVKVAATEARAAGHASPGAPSLVTWTDEGGTTWHTPWALATVDQVAGMARLRRRQADAVGVVAAELEGIVAVARRDGLQGDDRIGGRREVEAAEAAA